MVLVPEISKMRKDIEEIKQIYISKYGFLDMEYATGEKMPLKMPFIHKVNELNNDTLKIRELIEEEINRVEMLFFDDRIRYKGIVYEESKDDDAIYTTRSAIGAGYFETYGAYVKQVNSNHTFHIFNFIWVLNNLSHRDIVKEYLLYKPPLDNYVREYILYRDWLISFLNNYDVEHVLNSVQQPKPKKTPKLLKKATPIETELPLFDSLFEPNTLCQIMDALKLMLIIHKESEVFNNEKFKGSVFFPLFDCLNEKQKFKKKTHLSTFHSAIHQKFNGLDISRQGLKPTKDYGTHLSQFKKLIR